MNDQDASARLQKARLELRLAALEDDWNRMRDIETQWRDLTRFTVRAAWLVLFLCAMTPLFS